MDPRVINWLLATVSCVISCIIICSGAGLILGSVIASQYGIGDWLMNLLGVIGGCVGLLIGAALSWLLHEITFHPQPADGTAGSPADQP